MHASNATLAAGKPLFVVDFKDMVSHTDGNRHLKSIGKTKEAITSDSFNKDIDRYVDLTKPKKSVEALF